MSERKPPVGMAVDGVLAGGGEMGALMRALDWSQTPLGPIEAWPQSLRTTVSTCLDSRFPILVWWGPALVKLYNDAYRVILGDKHPRSMGRPGAEVWPEIWHIIGPMLDGVLREGRATWSENQYLELVRHGFPEECYFTFSYSPIRDESGGVGGVFCAVTETTREVLSERRLSTLGAVAARMAEARSEEAACLAAAEALGANPADVPFALIYMIDTSGQDTRTRARLVSSAGIEPGLALSPRVVDIADDVEIWPLAEALSLGEAVKVPIAPGLVPGGVASALVLPLVLSGQRPAAGFLVVGVSPRLVLDGGYQSFLGLVAGHVSSAIASARAFEAARRRAEALAELDRAKTIFFNNVSHEFRTPLTLMLGPMEDALAAGRALDGDELGLTYRSALRLLKLVNTLLDFSRIEAGRVRASFAPVDLGEVTAGLASVLRSAIERAGLRLVIDCAALGEAVYVDREMWEKIVLNLVSNAFKFTFEGEIEVVLRRAGERVELEVRDTGVGIAAAELPRIFERFHRIEGVKARTHEGSGIGLALVYELVQLHGGDIRAESELGRGTRFVVSLPLGAAHLAQDRITASASGKSTALAPFIEEVQSWAGGQPLGLQRSAAASAERVLVVDDNADLRDYLAGILGARWQVETAGDGQAALAIALRDPPDLVLTDVMMPGMNGFELLTALRAHEATRDVPVVMLSARAGEEARIDGLAAGANDYLVKPFSARELHARVGSQLALAAAERERIELRASEQAARREVQVQRENVEALFNQTPTPIVIMRGPERVFTLANPQACQVLGRSHEQLIGKPLHGALPELQEQAFGSVIDQVMRTGEPYFGRSMEANIDRGGGVLDTNYYNMVFAPLRDVSDEIEGVLALAFDVTDEVLARETMKQLRLDAEAANRAKDEFLAMLSHELRNPLAPILTALQVMRLRGLKSREYEVIERQVGHLARMVDDLLDVSRITRGKVELKRQRVELAEIVARAIEISSPLLEQRQHKLEVRVARSGLGVDVDHDRMAQVISNLVTNAAKYSDVGSRILIAAERRGSKVQLRVRDEGVGIAPEMLATVFDLFVQQPQTLDRAKGGLGLGLAIVRSMVELHGGRVRAASDGLGAGSEFTIELLAVELASSDTPAGTGPEPITPIDVRDTPRSPTGKRIMLVDDNVDAATILKEALELLGYTVAVAHDGPSALALAAHFAPEVALLDIGLPVMDGYELATRLRVRAPARLIALTGYGQDGDRERTRAAGFDAHLVKPVDITNLQAVVEARARAPESCGAAAQSTGQGSGGRDSGV